MSISLSRFAAVALATVTAASPLLAKPNNGPTTQSTPVCTTANAPVLSGITVLNGAAAWNELIGSRSVPNNGLTGCDVYAAGFQIGWNVTYNAPTSDYTYLYTFSGFAGRGAGLSHVILQLTAGCDTDDTCITNVATTAPAEMLYGTYTSADQGGSNPGLPAAITGVKFNTNGGDTGYQIQFNSTHAPVYGDFYAKAGQGFAYNDNVGLASGDQMGYIVRPDGEFAPPPPTSVPEPSTYALMATGLLALGGIARRRRATS